MILDKYKASRVQERMYVLNTTNPESLAYNITAAVYLEGNLNINKLSSGIKKLVESSSILNARFFEEDGQLFYTINELQNIDHIIETSDVSDFVSFEQYIEKMKTKFIRPFDMKMGNLYRFKLARFDGNRSILFMDFHHSILDGYGLRLFLKKLSDYYQRGSDIDVDKYSYNEFVFWQEKNVRSKEYEVKKKYWEDLFTEPSGNDGMIMDYSIREEYSDQTELMERIFIEKKTIFDFCKENNNTPFSFFVASLNFVLAKMSRNNDVTIGTVSSGRRIKAIQNSFGMFVNTLLLRNIISNDITAKDYIHEVHKNVRKALKNSDVQYEDIIAFVKEKDSKGNKFDVLLRFEESVNDFFSVDDFKCEVKEILPLSPISNIVICIEEHKENFEIRLNYAKEFYNRNTIQLLAECYIRAIKLFLTSSEEIVKYISLVNQEEREILLNNFNQKYTEYPANKTIVELFEEQVDKTPDSISAVFGTQCITYRELNGKANQLAGKLRAEYEIKPNDFVAVITERSIEMLISIYAILKAGGAYVPLDPEYPSERIEFILKDCRPKVVLCGTGKFTIPEDCRQLELADEGSYNASIENLEHVNTASDLIYVIYTSGTTGRPKGTMVEHRNVVNLLTHVITDRKINKDSVILQKTSYVFDVSVWELFAPLICGARIVILKSGDEKDPDKIAEVIETNQVTELSFVPSMFKAFVAEIKDNDPRLKTLEGIQLAGEALSPDLVESYKGPGKIFNYYGPTECTVYATGYICKKGDKKIPIGNPISNTQAYILNENELCNIGMPGELCLAGVGVARGYYNQPELTAKRFVKNPYADNIMYRTGDLVRWLSNGDIEYLGRIDEQIKIRGFRVELGEIESRIQEMEDIRETVVIAKEAGEGGTFICAYVVSEQQVDAKEIRDRLRKVLPDYMVPAFVMQIEAIPVTRNGKLDRKALPEPEYRSTSEYIAPRNLVEEMIVKVFKDILGVKQISVMDRFLDLGGDSIKAIRIVSKIREAGYQTSVKWIMSEQTPENIAKITKKEFTMVSAEQGEVTGEVKLTAIQRDFFEGGLRNPGYFNQSFLYDCKERVDLEALHKTLNQLAVHHDMLRAVYDSGIQRIGSTGERQWYHFHKFDCRVEDISEFADQMQSSINIEQGPLMRIGLFHTEEIDYLLVIIHHLVVDGVSWRILQEDLENGYRQAKAGKDIVLPAKTTSFKAWSESVSLYSRSSRLKREEEYWKKVLSQVESGKVKQDGHKGEKKTRLSEFSLNEQETIALVKNSNKAYNTEINDLMLTALTRAVNRVTGQTVVAIEMEGHGREEIGVELAVERTVGWFTSVYPAVFGNVGQEIGQDIREVKETLRRIPNKGIGYGILKNISRSMAERGTTADITFNYLGEFKAESDLFEISRHKHGTSVDPSNRFGAPISINGGIQNNVLSMGITYDESEYSAETMENLSKSFQKELTAVAMHCGHVEGTEYTASDYGETEWTEEEFLAAREKLAARGEEIKRIYPLTAMQEGILFEKLADEKSTQYVIQKVMKFSHLNIEQMQAAFEAVVKKHDILRTVIKYKAVGKARQILLKSRKPEYSYIEATTEEESLELRNDDVKRGFDLEEDTLLRMLVVKVSEGDFRLILTMHHIVVDGWSLSILFKDLLRFYKILDGQKEIPVEPAGSYEDFVRSIEAKEDKESLLYWEKMLEGYEEQADILPLGADEHIDEECIRVNASLSKKTTQKAVELCGKYNITVNTLMETVWGILLQKYNQSKDVVFGKVVSGRNAEVTGIEQMIGLFINLVPVRVRTEQEDTFEILIRRLQDQGVAGNEHDYCSLAEIQSKSLLGNGLIHTIMAFENYYIEDLEENITGIIDKSDSIREQTNYGITFMVSLEDALELAILYKTEKYSRLDAELLLRHFQTLLEHVIDQPQKALHEIPMIDQAEREMVVTTFNQTEVPYPRDRTVVQLFEKQAANTPDKLAVVWENQSLTYGELNGRANQLARKLREEYDVRRDDFVAIHTDRCLEMVVGIIAIIKAGGAYVPLDPQYPMERIAYILEDCSPKAVLEGNQALPEEISACKVDLMSEETYAGPEEDLEQVNQAEDLIYLIYTSGTTGNPKGTMIEHKNAVNLLTHVIKSRNLNEDSVILQKTSYIFDVSVWELFAPLLCGGRMILLENGHEKDPEKIGQAIEKGHITELSFVPSMFKAFVTEIEENDQRLKTLSGIQIAGEALSAELVNSYKGSGDLINFYGPTEDTVYATEYICSRGEKSVPIGRPISNTQAYVLNGLELCGIGAVGELCLAGDGVARGYLNRPELTSSRFLKNPFGEGSLYRTGDLVRWLPDGTIDYLGRIDEQVKIRGFRIELGEIETCLLKIDLIKEVAVIAREDRNGELCLCAYVMAEEEVSPSRIREELRKKLPDYMIPSYILQIEEIPVTRNGKLNRKALPEPEYQAKEGYAAPRNSLEEVAVEAFEGVLGVEHVGIHDNFFDLGGHSLKATKLINVIEKAIGIRMSVREIFAFSTPERIAEKIKAKEIGEYEEILPVKKAATYSMSSAQKRIYLLDQIIGASINYNIPNVIRIKGELDINRLQEALNQLTEREEIFRTSFHVKNGEPIQVITESVELNIEYSEQEKVDIQELFNDFVRPFDLSLAPLARIKIIKMEETFFLFYDIHHIISDGGSIPVMVNEIQELYNGKKLPELRVQYKDFSAWQNSRNVDDQAEYWNKELAGEIPVLNLKTDFMRPLKQSFHGTTLGRLVGKEIKEKVQELGKSQKATEFMVLLSVFIAMLHKYSGQQEIIVGTPISGRIHADTHKMLGMFINTLALKGEVNPDHSFSELLKGIKNKCLKAYDNQEYPFEELVKDINVQRDMSRNPLFDVMFILQNNEQEETASSLETVPADYMVSKFDITLSISETKEGYKASFEYCTDLFRSETIEYMAEHYAVLLKQVLDHPEKKLKEFSMLDASEFELITKRFNNTAIEYPHDKSVIELF
uniref:non-ribosomal peptide synthetase n=1 Tax=Lacrimispora sp. TaxID=2719234 RepID=UPI0028A718DF